MPAPSPVPADPQRLSDAEFQRLSQQVFAAIEAQIDRWLEDDVIDIDSQRSGGLLELGFPNGSKIILNTQPPLHELWLAAKGGGHHFRWQAGAWRDTRDGTDFLSSLGQHASLQGGADLRFLPP